MKEEEEEEEEKKEEKRIFSIPSKIDIKSTEMKGIGW